MKRFLFLLLLLLAAAPAGAQPSPMRVTPVWRAILATNTTVQTARNALGVVGDTNIVVNAAQLEFVADELNLKLGGTLPAMNAASLTNLEAFRMELAGTSGVWLTNANGSIGLNPDSGSSVVINSGDPKATALWVVGSVMIDNTNRAYAGLEIGGTTDPTNDIVRVSLWNGVPVFTVNSNGVVWGNGAALTNLSSANVVHGLTTNFTVLFAADATNRLWFTNGVLGAITVP